MHVPVDGTDETIQYPHPNRGPRDLEVERLARVVHSADWGTPVEECHAGTDDYRIAAAVLADLRERYVLVPREGLLARRLDDMCDVHERPFSAENLKTLVSCAGGVSRAWRSATLYAPLSAQNGPEDGR